MDTAQFQTKNFTTLQQVVFRDDLVTSTLLWRILYHIRYTDLVCTRQGFYVNFRVLVNFEHRVFDCILGITNVDLLNNVERPCFSKWFIHDLSLGHYEADTLENGQIVPKYVQEYFFNNVEGLVNVDFSSSGDSNK